MASDITQRLQEQSRLQDNADIAQADHDYQWKRTFDSTPPADVLRSRLNVADTVDRAIGNKLKIQAQSDVKALEILQKTAKMDEWNAQAPLREELLKRKVASEGAHERFVQQKDAESMADVAGFLDTVGRITAPVGTPEYQSQLTAAAVKHPRIIGTQVGADALKRLQKEHTDVSAMTPPAGKVLKRFEVTDDGKTKAVFEDAPVTTAIPSNLVPTGATQGKSGVQVQYGTPKAVKDVLTGALERERTLHQSAFDRASQRRIAAQRAFDKATTDDQKQANKDLILAADADIVAAKSALSDVDTQMKAHRDPDGAVSSETFGPPAAAASAPSAPVANKGALDWLAANPDDPRAAAVKAKLGL